MHAKLELWVVDQLVRGYVLRPGQEFLLGRGKDVNILVDDTRVSRQHALISLTREGLFVTDLASRNGTYLNEVCLKPHQRTPAVSGDRLDLGENQLRMELVGFDEESQRKTLEHRQADATLLPETEFEIMEEIGSGGVGRIWVARQKLPDRLVAIKLLRWELNPSLEDQRRFLREARLCYKIRSPNVVDIYDVRIVRGRPIIIMELVQGSTAKDRLEEGPLPIPEALKIAEDVARGLSAAAKLGIVHRDVKPSNILIGARGVAKLSDFGIAKDLGGQALTETGFGMGSLPYASPEQIVDAKDVDARADIYSLGATLYHLITGKPTFKVHKSILVTLELIAEAKPTPVATLRPECPSVLSDLIDTMLAKDREDRPSSVEDVAQQLVAIRGQFYPSWQSGPSTDPLADSDDTWPEELEGSEKDA